MPATDPAFEGSRPRRPSPLAVELTDAFEPLTRWAEVRVIRDASGRRDRVITDARQNPEEMPFDWAEAA